jgi:hypothetical protein
VSGTSKSSKNRKAAAAVAAARKTQARNRYLWLGSGLVVLVALVVVIAVVVVNRNSQQQTAKAGVPTVVPATPITTATGRDIAPPWPVPADVADSVHKAGLPMLGAEGSAEHIHVHLDILVNGQPVAVPALVGIDEAGQQISPLHTHDTSGVIHIESPTQRLYTLGQLFDVWGQPLGRNGVATYPVPDGNLVAYVDGQAFDGDPRDVVLSSHTQVVLELGAPAPPPPFTFPAGL